MALDPRIPLGVQPIQTQQPNMLAQYAQIMGIRAAQQDIQGNEDLRAAYAQGGDLNDPAFRQKVMAANPRLGSQLIKTNAETGKLQNEAIANRIKLSREMLTGVNSPEDYIAWHESNHKDPILGGYLGQRGVTAEQSRAKIMADLAKPGGLEKLKRESALGATELQKELMQTERTRISSGPAYQQAALAREKFNLDEKRQQDLQRVLAGGENVVGANPNVLADQAAPQGSPTPNVNALTGGGDAQQRLAQIDARIQQLVGLGTPDALRAADVLFKQRNVLAPSTGAVPGTIQEYNLAKSQGYGGTFTDFQKDRAALNAYGQPQEVTRKLEDGTSVTELVYPNPVAQTITPLSNLVRAEPPSGMGAGAPVQKPATAEKMQLKVEGKENVETVLGSLYDQYDNLVKEGGITDTRKSTADNITARTGASAAGQLAGSYTGSQAQQFRDSILQTRPLLLNAIKNATGMSAQQLNSNVELQTYLAVSTDPTKSIQSNVEAMNNISKMFGLSKEFKVPELPKPSSSSRTTAPSSAVVATPDGRTIVFPDAAAAAKFKKEAGIK